MMINCRMWKKNWCISKTSTMKWRIYWLDAENSSSTLKVSMKWETQLLKNLSKNLKTWKLNKLSNQAISHYHHCIKSQWLKAFSHSKHPRNNQSEVSAWTYNKLTVIEATILIIARSLAETSMTRHLNIRHNSIWAPSVKLLALSNRLSMVWSHNKQIQAFYLAVKSAKTSWRPTTQCNKSMVHELNTLGLSTQLHLLLNMNRCTLARVNKPYRLYQLITKSLLIPCNVLKTSMIASTKKTQFKNIGRLIHTTKG